MLLAPAGRKFNLRPLDGSSMIYPHYEVAVKEEGVAEVQSLAISSHKHGVVLRLPRTNTEIQMSAVQSTIVSRFINLV